MNIEGVIFAVYGMSFSRHSLSIVSTVELGQYRFKVRYFFTASNKWTGRDKWREYADIIGRFIFHSNDIVRIGTWRSASEKWI